MGPPQLDPRSNIPILLNFHDVEVGKIFEAISKASGINFIYDEKVELDRERTIDLGNVSLAKALDILMLQTKNFYKVIDEHTLLLAPDTRQKRQEYEDQVIRTFFLSNADTKTIVTLLRSLLQSRQIAENADLNSVTLKDTPEKVAIGERIIAANDKSKGEVLIDVELLQINRTTARNIGIDLSSKTLSVGFGDGQASVPLNNLDILRQTGNWTVGVIPSVILSFLKSDSDTKVVAKPQLRVSEGERAELLIGDRVPIPTTSFNTSQTVGGNIVPITSFTYQNVGITVQIQPRVHHNKEVTLKVQVEVSQVTGAVETSAGQAQPIIGTRQIQTVIRLRDGETNLLAGLIQRSRSDNQAGVAGISDIPGFGRIFSNNDIQTTDTDIVMTLTPRIIRIPDITEQDLATLWVGTEENMRLRGPAESAAGIGPFGPREDAVMLAGGSEPGDPVAPVVPATKSKSSPNRVDARRDRAGPRRPDPAPPGGAPATTTADRAPAPVEPPGPPATRRRRGRRRGGDEVADDADRRGRGGQPNSRRGRRWSACPVEARVPRRRHGDRAGGDRERIERRIGAVPPALQQGRAAVHAPGGRRGVHEHRRHEHGVPRQRRSAAVARSSSASRGWAAERAPPAAERWAPSVSGPSAKDRRTSASPGRASRTRRRVTCLPLSTPRSSW